MRISALLLIVLSRAGIACQCQTSYSACHEAAVSDVVFVGTVESIEPSFLSRWSVNNRTSLQTLNNVYMEAQQSGSADALDRFKAAYLKTFPDLAADARLELQGATTIASVTALFYSTLNRGMRVRFRVKTIYKQEDDDDEAEEFDVWTPFGDCGVEFQTGETYLVYADNDEASGVLSTTRCSRTRRVTDAGEDLGYLFFYKDRPEESSRVEGFTTTDEHYQLELSKMRDMESVRAPVAGLTVELQSDGLTRYAGSDGKGRFVFDGLAEGDYRVSVFSGKYPLDSAVLVTPRVVHVAEKSCALQVILIPKE